MRLTVRRILLVVPLALTGLAASGCTSVSVHFVSLSPPLPPHTGPVEVLTAPPAGPYAEVGVVTVTMSSFGSVSRSKAIGRLQEEAAANGANAIVLMHEAAQVVDETGVGIGGHTGTHGSGAGVDIHLTRRNTLTLAARALRLPPP